MTDVPTKEKKILPILLPSMVETENFSDHPRWLWSMSICVAHLHPGKHLEHELGNKDIVLDWEVGPHGHVNSYEADCSTD
jgi:hypothetical protein